MMRRELGRSVFVCLLGGMGRMGGAWGGGRTVSAMAASLFGGWEGSVCGGRVAMWLSWGRWKPSDAVLGTLLVGA